MAAAHLSAGWWEWDQDFRAHPWNSFSEFPKPQKHLNVLHFPTRKGCRIYSGQECEIPCADRDKSIQSRIKTVAQG